MGFWTRVGRQADEKGNRVGIPVHGLQVPQEGYSISLFFRDGEFIQSINGQEIKLHPWVGVQLEAFGEDRDWKRKSIGVYEPIDVMNWLKRNEL